MKYKIKFTQYSQFDFLGKNYDTPSQTIIASALWYYIQILCSYVKSEIWLPKVKRWYSMMIVHYNYETLKFWL